MRRQTADHGYMRSLNRAAILDHIRIHGQSRRNGIAGETGLAATTVSEIVSDLLNEGLLSATSERAAGRGRPASMLRLNAGAARALGVKISPYQISVALTDFAGNLLGTSVVPVRSARHPPEVIAGLIADAADHTLLAAGFRLDDIEGICVGVPGFVDGESGFVRWSPALSADEVDFGALVAERFGCPALVENDANLAALAEQWFGFGRGEENFILVSVEHGVGMGLVIGGRLARGAHGFAGEFGHMVIDPGGPECRCGRRGCIEAFAGDYALLRRAGLTDGAKPDPLTMKRLIAGMAAAPDEAAHKAAFREAGEAIGAGLAHAISLLNPGKVIFTGEMMRAADALVPAAKAVAESRVISALAGKTRYLIRRQGDEAWARGAAAAALQKLYRGPSWRQADKAQQDQSERDDND